MTGCLQGTAHAITLTAIELCQVAWFDVSLV